MSRKAQQSPWLRASARPTSSSGACGSGTRAYGIAFAPSGLVALAPQAIILGSIFGVTGIPPTENQAIRSKGDVYRAYQARVSKFVPMPPKAPRASTQGR